MWGKLLALIEPHYPKTGNGTQPKPIEQMLRIYFMQNWFNLSDGWERVSSMPVSRREWPQIAAIFSFGRKFIWPQD